MADLTDLFGGGGTDPLAADSADAGGGNDLMSMLLLSQLGGATAPSPEAAMIGAVQKNPFLQGVPSQSGPMGQIGQALTAVLAPLAAAKQAEQAQAAQGTQLMLKLKQLQQSAAIQQEKLAAARSARTLIDRLTGNASPAGETAGQPGQAAEPGKIGGMEASYNIGPSGVSVSLKQPKPYQKVITSGGKAILIEKAADGSLTKTELGPVDDPFTKIAQALGGPSNMNMGNALLMKQTGGLVKINGTVVPMPTTQERAQIGQKIREADTAQTSIDQLRKLLAETPQAATAKGAFDRAWSGTAEVADQFGIKSVLGEQIRAANADIIKSWTGDNSPRPDRVAMAQAAGIDPQLDRTFTPDKWLSAKNVSKFDAAMNVLAYRLARMLDPTGRLSDFDVQNAKNTIGGGGLIRTTTGVIQGLQVAQEQLDAIVGQARKSQQLMTLALTPGSDQPGFLTAKEAAYYGIAPTNSFEKQTGVSAGTVRPSIPWPEIQLPPGIHVDASKLREIPSSADPRQSFEQLNEDLQRAGVLDKSLRLRLIRQWMDAAGIPVGK